MHAFYAAMALYPPVFDAEDHYWRKSIVYPACLLKVSVSAIIIMELPAILLVPKGPGEPGMTRNIPSVLLFTSKQGRALRYSGSFLPYKLESPLDHLLLAAEGPLGLTGYVEWTMGSSELGLDSPQDRVTLRDSAE